MLRSPNKPATLRLFCDYCLPKNRKGPIKYQFQPGAFSQWFSSDLLRNFLLGSSLKNHLDKMSSTGSYLIGCKKVPH